MRTLNGMNVRLVPYETKHAFVLVNWYYDFRYAQFFRDMDEEPYDTSSIGRLVEGLARNGIVLLVIEELATDKPLGLMTWNMVKKKAGIYRFGILLDEDTQHKTLAIESIIIMSHYLYAGLGCTKMVVEFLASNTHIQRISEKGGFIREAVLDKEAFLNGEYVDEVRYYLTREKAYELYGEYYRMLDELNRA
ncbi:GNAT family N-acetyltransferase [bacterium]|nr:GNAT family N-acetyltransferase [bacterium]